MALILKNKIDLLSGATLNVYDTSGTYNASTNLTGWGGINITRAGITSATVAIFLPDEDTAAITSTVTSTVQAAVGEEFLLKAFSLTDLTLTDADVLPDGIYRVVYTVVSGGVTYTNDQYFLSYYEVSCCVQNKFADFIDEDCGCNDGSEVLTQWAMLKAIMFAVAGGNLTEAQTMLTRLQRMCDTNTCC